MLTENDIVDKLSAHLQADGYEILQSLGTKEKGVDIIAKKNGQTLFIEAKGETSSKSHTNRFGKPFTKNQIKSHVSRALLASMRILTSQPAGQSTAVAIALPDTVGHRDLINEINLSLKELDIIVFWVSQTTIRKA